MKGTPARNRNRRKDATEKCFIEIAWYCPDDQFGFVPSRVTRGRPDSDFPAALEGKNYDQSPLFINLYNDTTASRAVEQLKKSPPPSPLRYQGTKRGVLNREGATNIPSSLLPPSNPPLLPSLPVSAPSSAPPRRSEQPAGRAQPAQPASPTKVRGGSSGHQSQPTGGAAPPQEKRKRRCRPGDQVPDERGKLRGCRGCSPVAPASEY